MTYQTTLHSERVQKIIAQAGIASRRAAERLIEEGVVTINGKRATLGDKATAQDAIKVRGKLIPSKETPVYLVFNKPKSVISMIHEDPQGRPTLAHYLGKVRKRVFPIGRLPFNTEGLLLLTNDGEMSKAVQSCDQILRVYEVKIDRVPDEKELEKLNRGVKLENGKILKPHSVRIKEHLAKKVKLEMAFIGSGSLEIKEFIDAKRFRVDRIVRTQIGQIRLGQLQPGEYLRVEQSKFEAMLFQPELGLKLLEKKAKNSRKELPY